MINYEKYKDQVIELIAKGNRIGLLNDKIVNCDSIHCDHCGFNKIGNCYNARRDWLNAEYVEQPKLTQRERKLCEVIETGWIARDKNGMLFLYDEEPGKGVITWSREASASRLDKILLGGFAFIRWQDDEPWTVEDLLKLEVEE